MLFPMYAQQPVNSDAGVFPETREFIESPAEYTGERVVTEGIVQQQSPIVIEAETTEGTHNLTVTGTSLSPSPGDKFRVQGTLVAPRTINSHTAFVVPPSGLWYTWGISFLAGIWVLLRLIRQWKISSSPLCVSRRDTPLTARQVFATTETETKEENA